GESGVGSSGSPDDSLLETSLTETGTRVGTPAYMSPEQLAGRTVDARCDQFSFCVTAWEVLFGVRPYAGARLDGLLAAFRAEGLKRPADIEIPERVEAALRRGLSVRPGARFADMASLLEVLETELRILRKEQVRPASWRGWKVLGAVVLVSLGVFAVAKVREARRIAACETEGAAIGQLWDDDVRRTSLAALRSTPKGALVHDEDRLSPWLDAYVEELADAHVQACRHRSVEQDWDAELSEKAAWCLEERRDELEQEIGSYADGDPALSVVDRALAMSPVRPCLDSRALERLELPPPGSRAEVKSFKGELSASARLGDEALEERLTLVRDLKARASSVDWAPLQTELRRAEGGVLVDLGRATEGVAVLEKVWFESAESSRWEAAASIAAYLASIATLDNPDAEVARRWLALATVCLRQSYDPAGRLELRLVESQLSYETTFGDVKKAEKIARELLDGRRRIYGDAHVQVAAAQSWLAAVLSGQGRLEEAIALGNALLKLNSKPSARTASV
ncbi:MAG: tetratricopeptide repeat-containing protein kinase family protein, partial [Myxococcota bacterium]